MFLNCSSAFLGPAVLLPTWVPCISGAPPDCALAYLTTNPNAPKSTTPARTAALFAFISFSLSWNFKSLASLGAHQPATQLSSESSAIYCVPAPLPRAAQRISTYPSPPPPLHRRTPPSFRRKSDLPTTPSSPDRDCADCSWNCHTRQLPAASSPPSAPAARLAGSSTASESDSSPATALPRCHRHAQCRIQTVSPADACEETGSAASHHSAACPAPPRENRPHPEE